MRGDEAPERQVPPWESGIYEAMTWMLALTEMGPGRGSIRGMTCSFKKQNSGARKWIPVA